VDRATERALQLARQTAAARPTPANSHGSYRLGHERKRAYAESSPRCEAPGVVVVDEEAPRKD
jgi:hypothetical protein